VPAAVAAVAELPVSPNGKVDRKELTRRAREVKAAGSAGELDLPAGPVAVLATELWKEHLMVEQVGAADDFFLLGGDSMAAIQVVRGLAAKASLDIPARALFDAPTLGEFIDYVTKLGLLAGSGPQ
jgi:acyl carrier protein